MELDEFVKSVLIQILSGVREAQKDEALGGLVVAGKDGGHDYPKNSRVSSSAQLKSTIIDFDVAISVETTDKASGSGGLKVAGIGAGIEGEISSKDTRVSRIQFGVPILLPKNERNWYEDLQKSNS
ncbi:MAG: hypothetical protein CMP91_02590 [Gammaproteobacteria bacterium]|nr:hypothetical protein [Gammaproteobacteria bacterium]|tara:strand:- start:175096 stop:175473 length:378 start_codon:yes stop_codon:yes gene_type:complete